MTDANSTPRRTLERLEAELEGAIWKQRADADAAREREEDWVLWMTRGQKAVDAAKAALAAYVAANPDAVAAIEADRVAERAIARDEARLRHLDYIAVDGLTEAEETERARLAAESSARFRAREAAAKAAFAAEWTREETIARRAKWNSLVAAFIAKNGSGKGKITSAQLAELERQAGFSHAAVGKAIALHDLKGKTE